MVNHYPLSSDDDALRLAPGARRVVVDTPSASVIRDLSSVRRDFLIASTFLQAYLESDIEGEDPAAAPNDALWIAAVTMYGRAFATGHRHRGRPVPPSDATPATAHQYFFDLRNKYIAHSVNGFERSTVFVDLPDPAQNARGISSIGESQINLNRLSRERAHTLLSLCRDQLDAVNIRIEDLHQDVAAELVAMGPVAVYALPDFDEPVLDSSNPRARRH